MLRVLCSVRSEFREGVIRADRITWTGHVRDTVLFSILASEWDRSAVVHR